VPSAFSIGGGECGGSGLQLDPHRKPCDDIKADPPREGLASDGDRHTLSIDSNDARSQITAYEHHIRKSDAYRWLRRTTRLQFPTHDLMSKIGITLQTELQAQDPLRKLSHRGPSLTYTISYKLDWNPVSVLRDLGVDPSAPGILGRVLCLTGTISEAQATTVAEYIAQTWPETAEPVVMLVSNLLSLPEGAETFCKQDEYTRAGDGTVVNHVPP